MEKIKNKIKSSAPAKNSASAFVGNIVNILTKFVLQKVFIDSLGVEYLGLNGVLTNIISALSIVELGISSAIIFNLYEPIKTGKVEVIKSLMKFYRKAYCIIALITAGASVILLPFLHLIVREPVPGVNMYLAFILISASTIASYMMSYRQSILYATEHGYITTNVQTVTNIITALLQAVLLVFVKNYYIYLSISIIMQLLKNFYLYRVAEKRYPILRDRDVKKLDKVIEKDIFKKMRALFIHKVSTFIIFSTDNIIISAFINVATVGLYSNYHMIFSAVETIFMQTIKALTPTVGNMLVDKNVSKNFKTFQKIRHVNFMVVLISSVGIMLLADLFVKLWYGGEYVLSSFTLITLLMVHFQRMMRESYSVFKEAAGIYHEDRFVPVVESLLNIVVSVVLVQLIGLPGVFIGTFVSSLALWFYSYPKFVYTKLFGRTYKQYFGEMLLYCLIYLAVMVLAWLIKGWVGI
ncbi:oligosaccharide flippase family protein [Candidatus Saccharibacteria bacterium]|nr:oligosaccharide flippase family protein [Candidatus Saccharibacteria bacterium]